MSTQAKPAPTGPDRLLVELAKSIMPKAIVISVIAHVVVTVITSFSLFADWAYTRETKDSNGAVTVERPFFLKAPAAINQLKTRFAREAEEKARKEAAEEKARKAAAEAAAAAKTNKVAKASAPAKKGDKAPAAKDGQGAEGAKDAKEAAEAKPGKDGAVRDGNGKVTKAPEVEALPPKTSFEYGEDLSLD